MKFITYSRALINENKWRAARYGIDGKMIDFGKEMEVNTRSLVLELLDFVDDVVDDLGSRDDLQYVHKILETGTGADRQLAVYQQNNNFADVVDYITSQTLKGL
jgi:carboxylate-amine ligase